MTENSIDLLARGLLDQFASLKELEQALIQLLGKQHDMLGKDIDELNYYQNYEQIEEISLMVWVHHSLESLKQLLVLFQMKKMNLYRLKIKQLRSEMLYIHQRVSQLRKKSLEIQTFKAEEKAEKIKRYDYEQGLIAKSKK